MSTKGIELKIDSSKFEPVLLKVDEKNSHILYIVDKQGIKEIETIQFIHGVLGFLIGSLVTLLVVGVLSNKL